MTEIEAVKIAIQYRRPIVDNRICWFSEEYSFLSNFYPSPIFYGGATWPTVEHCYQAYKTTSFEQQELIREATSPAKAKKLGRYVTMRKDWDWVKLPLMEELVSRKFITHPDLMQKLIDTKSMTLIEGNYWFDSYWGMTEEGGTNHLGKILMNIRNKQ